MTKKLTFAFFAAAILAGMLFVISCQKENGEVSKKEVVVEKQLTQKTSESVFDFKKFKADAEKKGGKLVKFEGETGVAGCDLYLYYTSESSEPVKLLIPTATDLPYPNHCDQQLYVEASKMCCSGNGGTCTWVGCTIPHPGGICIYICGNAYIPL